MLGSINFMKRIVWALARLTCLITVCLYAGTWLATVVRADADSPHATLQAIVVNQSGDVVENAVLSLQPVDDATRKAVTESGKTAPVAATIRQADGQFKPLVTAVQRGASIEFPNEDHYHHNVYSFSSARRFQLPLYREETPPPVLFDKAGTVVLGCNIHDWMVAYVRVLPTPFFAISDSEGKVRINGLPHGVYDASIWHPQRKSRRDQPQRITVGENPALLNLQIRLVPQWRQQP